MITGYYVKAVRMFNLTGQPWPRIGTSKYTRTYRTRGEAELAARAWREDLDWMVLVMPGRSPRG